MDCEWTSVWIIIICIDVSYHKADLWAFSVAMRTKKKSIIVHNVEKSLAERFSGTLIKVPDMKRYDLVRIMLFLINFPLYNSIMRFAVGKIMNYKTCGLAKGFYSHNNKLQCSAKFKRKNTCYNHRVIYFLR